MCPIYQSQKKESRYKRILFDEIQFMIVQWFSVVAPV